jgi:3-dehydroquinate synthase
LLEGWQTIVVPAGEQYKQQHTISGIITQLIEMQADRKSIIVGMGGGVITDMAGYVAAVYMRGVKCGFVPTTVLAMVDAAIGGKCGVDVGVYKNLVGVIRQPDFLLYDASLLKTLPQEQWINGFAEIIKHACIKDAAMFTALQQTTIAQLQNNAVALARLIEQNVRLKMNVVLQDEFEQQERKLLNFGHTFGHAIENTYALLHGHAVSIGMGIACAISEEINGFDSAQKASVLGLLQQYQLPVKKEIDKQKVMELMMMDKKRTGSTMDFVLLNKIGEATIIPVPVIQLQHLISMLA